MKETKFQSKLVELLTKRGAVVLNVHGHAMQKSGFPDLRIAIPMWLGWLELKVGKNKCSSIQREMIERLKRCGDKVFVLRHLESDEEGVMGRYADSKVQLEDELGNVITTAEWPLTADHLLSMLVANGVPQRDGPRVTNSPPSPWSGWMAGNGKTRDIA